MHSKNYIRIAEVVKMERDYILEFHPNEAATICFNNGQLAGIEKIARRLAEYMRAENPNFNTDQFLRACGVE